MKKGASGWPPRTPTRTVVSAAGAPVGATAAAGLVGAAGGAAVAPDVVDAGALAGAAGAARHAAARSKQGITLAHRRFIGVRSMVAARAIAAAIGGRRLQILQPAAGCQSKRGRPRAAGAPLPGRGRVGLLVRLSTITDLATTEPRLTPPPQD